MESGQQLTGGGENFGLQADGDESGFVEDSKV